MALLGGTQVSGVNGTESSGLLTRGLGADHRVCQNKTTINEETARGTSKDVSKGKCYNQMRIVHSSESIKYWTNLRKVEASTRRQAYYDSDRGTMVLEVVPFVARMARAGSRRV